MASPLLALVTAKMFISGTKLEAAHNLAFLKRLVVAYTRFLVLIFGVTEPPFSRRFLMVHDNGSHTPDTKLLLDVWLRCSEPLSHPLRFDF